MTANGEYGNKLFIANLSYGASEEELRVHFEQVGPVQSAKICIADATGKSRGFGFVEMADGQSALAAIERLHDQDFQGRRLTVEKAKSRQRR